MRRVLVVKTGTTDPAVRARHGDYDDWFVRALSGLARCEVTRPFDGEALPAPEGWSGVLLTGSPLSVRDEAPWMADLGAWTLQAARRVDVFAVCFGHQLVGEALGGWVDLSAAGREIGTIDVALTAAGRADPIFGGLPPTVRVQSTHSDALVTAPAAEGVVRLAGNPHTAWQAFRYGRLAAVQFHPEIPARALVDLLAGRGQSAPVEPAPHGQVILENWVASLPDQDT